MYDEKQSASLYRDRIVDKQKDTGVIGNAVITDEDEGSGGSVYTFVMHPMANCAFGVNVEVRPIHHFLFIGILPEAIMDQKKIQLSEAVDITCGYSSTHLMACNRKSLVSFGDMGNYQ